MFQVSIVIPILNEEFLLRSKLSTLANFFDSIYEENKWLILFVDNGSSDKSSELIDHFIGQNKQCERIFLHKPNYGKALKIGLEGVSTKYACISDIDQLDSCFLSQSWELRDAYDLFIGSKRIDPTLCNEPKFRTFLSWGLNTLINLLFRYPGTETHGPKLINYSSLKDLISICHSGRGQFDTEFVIRSFYSGNKIVEIPTEYQNLRRSRNLMLSKVVRNIIGMYLLKNKLKHLKFKNSPKYSVLERKCVCSNLSGESS